LAVSSQQSGRTASGLSALRPANLAELAAARIVDAIADGSLRPGQRLIETDLAADLGVSRLPVREAFKMLATQGILDLNLHRGARIAPIGADRLDTVRAARTTLEALAAVKAAAAYRRDPAGLAVLDAIVDRMKREDERTELDALNRLDIEFHRAVVAAAGDPFLAALWEALSLPLRIVFAWEVRTLPHPVAYASVHLAIRYALAREPDRVLADLIGRHIAGRSEIDPGPSRAATMKTAGRKK